MKKIHQATGPVRTSTVYWNPVWEEFMVNVKVGSQLESHYHTTDRNDAIKTAVTLAIQSHPFTPNFKARG